MLCCQRLPKVNLTPSRKTCYMSIRFQNPDHVRSDSFDSSQQTEVLHSRSVPSTCFNRIFQHRTKNTIIIALTDSAAAWPADPMGASDGLRRTPFGKRGTTWKIGVLVQEKAIGHFYTFLINDFLNTNIISYDIIYSSWSVHAI